MDLKTTPATWHSAQFKSVALSCPVAEPWSLARFCNPMHWFRRDVGSLSSVVFLCGDTSLYQMPSSQGLTMVSSPPPPSVRLLKYQVDHGVGHKYSKPVISVCKTEFIDNKHSCLFSSTRQTLGSLHRGGDIYPRLNNHSQPILSRTRISMQEVPS